MQKFYLHSDHLNAPRFATSEEQVVQWQWKSDAFGVGPANTDVDGDGTHLQIALRFPGQQYDEHSRLNYNYFRDYDPNTGRYVVSDPIGLDGGLNTYGYVMGNPIVFFDPDGLERMNLLDPNDHVVNNTANSIPDQKGTLQIWGHATRNSIKDDSNGKINRVSLDPAALAQRIKQSGVWHPEMPIVIWGCDSGDGEDSLAAHLSKILNVTVKAPDGRLVVMGGDYFVRKGLYSFSPKGSFVTYQNGSQIIGGVAACSCPNF